MAGMNALLIIAASLAASIASPALAGAGDESILVARAQWHRALAGADEATLARLLTDDFTVIESSGNRNDKAAVIERAKKPEIAMTLTASRPAIRRSGAIATVTGPVLEQRGASRIEFEVTDVLVRQAGRWRLASSHWTRAVGDLSEVVLSDAELDRLSGRYRGPRGAILTVARRAKRLAITEPSGQEIEFIALSPTMFAGPGGRVRWLFLAEPDGAIGHAVIANLNVLTALTRERGR